MALVAGLVAVACGCREHTPQTVVEPAPQVAPADGPAPNAARALERSSYRQLAEPRPATQPTAVARLRLPRGKHVDVAAWRSTAGKLCVYSELKERFRSSLVVGGPCMRRRVPCIGVCLDSLGFKDEELLSGVVDRRATTLRVRVSDGSTHVYRLTGPRIPRSDWRVAIVALPRPFREAKATRGGTVLGTQTITALALAIEECSKSSDSIAETLACVGAKAPPGGWPQP